MFQRTKIKPLIQKDYKLHLEFYNKKRIDPKSTQRKNYNLALQPFKIFKSMKASQTHKDKRKTANEDTSLHSKSVNWSQSIVHQVINYFTNFIMDHIYIEKKKRNKYLIYLTKIQSMKA